MPPHKRPTTARRAIERRSGIVCSSFDGGWVGFNPESTETGLDHKPGLTAISSDCVCIVTVVSRSARSPSLAPASTNVAPFSRVVEDRSVARFVCRRHQKSSLSANPRPRRGFCLLANRTGPPIPTCASHSVASNSSTNPRGLRLSNCCQSVAPYTPLAPRPGYRIRCPGCTIGTDAISQSKRLTSAMKIPSVPS